MWVAFACGSAFFAGITAILAKCGIRETDSTVATAIRTIVVLAFAWVMVAVVGSAGQIGSITPMTWAFLGLSGLATGASWLCYFKALQFGDVNKVVPIDKSSTVLTMLLAFLLLGEPLSWASVVAMALILAGTLMMVERKPTAAADAVMADPGLARELSASALELGNSELGLASNTKKAGIRAVLSALGPDAGTTYGFGDAENDLPLFAEVDVRVAMGNAVDALKARADYVTGSVHEDGVVSGLAHFGLI